MELEEEMKRYPTLDEAQLKDLNYVAYYLCNDREWLIDNGIDHVDPNYREVKDIVYRKMLLQLINPQSQAI